MIRRFCAFVFASLFLLLPSLWARQLPQAPATFKTTSTAVPVDVRVLDRDGNPITDLTQADFTLREEGVPQKIAHFSFETLEPAAVQGSENPVLFRNAGTALDPAQRRVVLIMLGRGELELPFKGITAAIDFVRTRLMPQDFVAVMAYNRATEFTTDHEQVAKVLERFKDRHSGLERRLQVTLGGLAGIYGDRRIPASMQAEIDRMFEEEGAASRQVQNDPAQLAATTRQDLRREMDDLLDRARGSNALMNPAFDHFLAWIAPTMQDSGNVLAGIEYMRFIDGEKRLVFVTEEGFAMPRTESDLAIASAAAEARVAVDTIHTGGTPAAPIPGPGSGLNFDDLFRRMSALGTMKILSELTGGFRYSTIRPEAAFASIDDVTRSQYLLAYYPSNPARDGRFRRIEVNVNRPGARVHVRRGYYASETPRSFDRARVMTDSRIAMAMSHSRPITDLKVDLAAAPVKTPEGGSAVAVSGTIDSSRLGWMQAADGRKRVALELAIVCLDDRGMILGEHRQPLVLAITQDVYDKSLEAGIKYGVTVPVTAHPHQVRVVVYDPAVDLVGSDMRRLR